MRKKASAIAPAHHAPPAAGKVSADQPVQPYLVNGQLPIRVMAWSGKVTDLRRDPHYALHRVVTAPDAGESELKHHGSVGPADGRVTVDSPVADGMELSS